MANWSELPKDIIHLFVKRVSAYVEDFASFSAVCKSWRSVAVEEKEKLVRCCAPWLILAEKANDSIGSENEVGRVRSFYSLYRERLLKLDLPQTQGRRCWGTPYGWLFIIGIDLNIHLLNPLTATQISLPSQTTFQDQQDFHVEPRDQCQPFVHKFALASNPSLWTHTTTTTPTLVMAIYSGVSKLAVTAPGDEAWRSLEIPPGPNHDDVIFFNGHFYAITTLGTLRICDINTTDQPKATDFAAPPEDINAADMFYLVDLSGELHFVTRASDFDDDAPSVQFHFEAEEFQVFKLDFHTRKWSVVEDLGDHAFFLDNNTSFAISTIDYPEFKPSCIYFIDDHSDLYDHPFCDMGVYDIRNNSIHPIYFCGDNLSEFSRPLFFMPTL